MSFQEFECLEPELQEKVSEHPLEELDPVTRKRWEQHLGICHACREEHERNLAIADLLAAGVGVPVSEKLGLARWRRSWQGLRARRLALSGGGLALVAMLTLFLLPPSARPLFSGKPGAVKSGGEQGFTIKRPHEGEVLYLSGGALEWDSVDDARGYRITLESLDGSYRWSGTASSTGLRLPEGSEGPGDYTAAVRPFPEDLAPAGEQSVAFRRDHVLPFLAYRIKHLHWLSGAILALSLILTAVAVFKRS
jgi:hypothetical protein